jgi:2-polyprenyl-3-methyl-5-hydroxy-6-metoxy-1,4-benzoquinol methylase
MFEQRSTVGKSEKPLMSKGLDKEQQIQEAIYTYPYHYIAQCQNGRFSQVQYWPWGFIYLGVIDVVYDQLKRLSFDSLIDVGCGDGRFLREMAKRYPNVKLLGIDYSERAIQFAKSMNPSLNFKTSNIISEPLRDRFDVATSIEVLEHIPPEQVPCFLEAIANILHQDGSFVLTVPHTNKKVPAKHYQHFTSNHLRELLEPHFRDIVFVPFDRKSTVILFLRLIIGGKGTHFLVTERRLLYWFYQLYTKRYLYAHEEGKCGRIAAISRRR